MSDRATAPELQITLPLDSVRSGGLLHVQVDAGGAPVRLRLLRQLRVPGGGGVQSETRVCSWDPNSTADRRVELHQLAPSWRGKHVEVAYLVEATTPSGQRATCPVTVLPGRAPEQDPLRATAAQLKWRDLQRSRRGCGAWVQGLVEVTLTLGAAAWLAELTWGLLHGRHFPESGWIRALAAAGWLCAYGVVWVRRVLDANARVGRVTQRTAMVGGSFLVRALRPLRWSLLLDERYSVVTDTDGETRPLDWVRTMASGRVGVGRFEIPVPTSAPASVGSFHAGLSWWISLDGGRGTTRIPVTVLPWFSPEAEPTEIHDEAADA